MSPSALKRLYRDHIACLNARDWPELGGFVGDAVSHNGERIGLSGYRRLLERDVEAIPDLRFVVDVIVCEPPRVACRLTFDCTPRGSLFGLAVNGRRIRFAENVIYEFGGAKIESVRSIIDVAAIRAQLGEPE